MPIVCLAVVGPLNNPAFIQCFPPATAAAAAGTHPPPTTSTATADSTDRELRLHFIVHCALDAVEDKVRGMPPALSSPCMTALDHTLHTLLPPYTQAPVIPPRQVSPSSTLPPVRCSAPLRTPPLAPPIRRQVLQKRAPLDAYLGLLYPTEEFRVYG